VAAAPERLLVYRSFPLDIRNENIMRALIYVHGGGRNANDYFNTAMAAAFLAGALDDTIIVAPRSVPIPVHHQTALVYHAGTPWQPTRPTGSARINDQKAGAMVAGRSAMRRSHPMISLTKFFAS
jgi:hypothetical protein